MDSTSRKADFVLKVSGDSMNPAYDDRDLILIQSTEAIDPGKLGVFGVNGSGHFKRLGRNELLSLIGNTSPYKSAESDKVRCFGRVLGKTERVG